MFGAGGPELSLHMAEAGGGRIAKNARPQVAPGPTYERPRSPEVHNAVARLKRSCRAWSQVQIRFGAHIARAGTSCLPAIGRRSGPSALAQLSIDQALWRR
jgi:hypothetical protein